MYISTGWLLMVTDVHYITTGYVIPHDKIYPINWKFEVSAKESGNQIRLHMNTAQNTFQVPFTVVLVELTSIYWLGSEDENMRCLETL